MQSDSNQTNDNRQPAIHVTGIKNLLSIDAFLLDKVFNQPVNIFIVRRWESYAGMGRWIFGVLTDEIESPLVRPFAPIRMAIGETERARFKMI